MAFRLLDQFLEHLNPASIILQLFGSLLVMGISVVFIRSRSKMIWKERFFLERVGFSYIDIDESGTRLNLRVRTIFERNLGDALLQNQEAINCVIATAREVSLEDPILTWKVCFDTIFIVYLQTHTFMSNRIQLNAG